MMPHVIMEYSSNIKQVIDRGVLKTVHKAMIDSTLFAENSIKSRAYEAINYLIGSQESDGSFIHLTIYLFAGRSLEQKKSLSESLMSAMQALLGTTPISINIIDIDHDVYRKSE